MPERTGLTGPSVTEAVQLLMDASENLRHGSEWNAGVNVERRIDAVWAICPPSGQDCLCMDAAEQAEDGMTFFGHRMRSPRLLCTPTF